MKAKVEAVNKLLLEGEPGNISTDEHSGYTGYKPQHIIDAMNEVFFGEWGFAEVGSEIVPGDKGALAVAQVQVWLAGLEFKPTSWGQNRVTRGDIGDARKGAQTDAIKKALSYFSIGNRAYQGLLKEDAKGNASRQSTAPQSRTEAPGASNGHQPRTTAPTEATPAPAQPQKPNPVDLLKTEAVKTKFITGKDKAELANMWQKRLRAIFGNDRNVTDADLAESEALRANVRNAMERYAAKNAQVAEK